MVKSIIISDRRTRKIKALSHTQPGKTSDKRTAKEKATNQVIARKRVRIEHSIGGTEVALPECIINPDQIISISFHTKAAGETVKDVSYVCDGRIFSREYNDFGILQGTIEWTYERPSGATP